VLKCEVVRKRSLLLNACGLLVVLLGTACGGKEDSEATDPTDPTDSGATDSGVADQVNETPPSGISSWASFGRDLEHTRSNPDESTLTVDTASTLAEAWSLPAPGVTGTPAIVDGVVYWGDWKGVAHAVRADDGTTIWESTPGAALYDSPAVAGGRVYFGDMAGAVHALEAADGQIVWSATIANYPVETFLGTDVGTTLFGSPAVIGDTLVIGTASAPFSKDQTFRGNVVSLNTSDGAERWRLDVTRVAGQEYATGVSVWSSPAIDSERKLAFIGTGQSYGEPASPLSDSLLAIDYETGEIIWSEQFTPNDHFTFEVLIAGGAQGGDFDVGAAPNLFEIGDLAVVGVGDKSGMYYVLDRQTGEQVWGTELTPGSPLGGVMTAAAISDGKVFVTSNNWGNFGGNFLDIPFTDPLNRCHVFALDAATGTVIWQNDHDSVCIGGVTFAAGVVYVGTTNGTLLALSAADGTELWRGVAGTQGIAGGSAVVDGRLFVGHGWSFSLSGKDTSIQGGLIAYAPAD
jgi:polyvinyl alcohol dehydrogenase (cytochrome)